MPRRALSAFLKSPRSARVARSRPGSPWGEFPRRHRRCFTILRRSAPWIDAAAAANCAQSRVDLIASSRCCASYHRWRARLQNGQAHRARAQKRASCPYKRYQEDYALEYGTATIEIHADARKPGDPRADHPGRSSSPPAAPLLAAAKLFKALQGEVVGVAAIIDLPELGGSQRLREAGLPVHSLCTFDEVE